MASQAEVSIVLKLIDKMSGQLNTISKSAKTLGKNTTKLGRSLTRNVSLPLFAVGVASLKMASDLDTALRDVQSITKQTDAEIKQLSKDMIALSTDMSTGAFSAEKYTRAYYDIQSAGFAASDAMDILEVSSRAATAGQADLATAVGVSLSTLKAFNMEASEVTRVNDLLFTGVRIGKQTYDQLATAVRLVGPTFAAFNVPVEDAIAALTLFANKGTSAEEAATQLKSIVLELNDPTAELAYLINQAGFASGRQMLATLGTTRALEALNRVSIQENVILSDTFSNRRAQIGIMTLTGQNMNELMQIQGELANSTGELDAAFQEQAKAFSFQFKKMMASIQKVLIIIGNELIPIVLPMIEGIKKAAEAFSNLDESTKKNIVRFGVFVAVAGPLLIIVGSLISAIGAIAGVFAAGGAAATAASAGVGLLNVAFALLAANPIVLAIVAIGAAIGALMLLFPGFRKAVMDIFKGIGDAVSGAVNTVKNLFSQSVTIVKGLLGYDVGKKVGENFGNGIFTGLLTRMKEGMTNVVEMNKQVAQTSTKVAQTIVNNFSQATGIAAKGLVHLMSLAQVAFSGAMTAEERLAAAAATQAQADAIRQQLLSGLESLGGVFGGLGGFGGLGDLGGGMSLIDRLKSFMSSGDFQQADADTLIQILGGTAGAGGGGGLTIIIENLYAPGTPEELIKTIMDALADELKKLGIA